MVAGAEAGQRRRGSRAKGQSGLAVDGRCNPLVRSAPGARAIEPRCRQVRGADLLRDLQRLPPQSAGTQAIKRRISSGTLYHRPAGSRGDGRISLPPWVVTRGQSSSAGHRLWGQGRRRARPRVAPGAPNRASQRKPRLRCAATPGRRAPGSDQPGITGPIGRDEATPPIRQRGNGQAAGRRRGQRRGGSTSADRDRRPRAVTCRRRFRGVAPDLRRLAIEFRSRRSAAPRNIAILKPAISPTRLRHASASAPASCVRRASATSGSKKASAAAAASSAACSASSRGMVTSSPRAIRAASSALRATAMLIVTSISG